MDNPRRSFDEMMQGADKQSKQGEPTLSGRLFASVIGLCIVAAAIMGTVKLGMVLFS